MRLKALFTRILRIFWPSDRVFVSYAREHKVPVKTYVEVLQCVRKPVFFDGQIEPGTEWQKRLDQELLRAGTVMVFWCSHAQASQYVQSELDAARDLGLRMLPMIIDSTALPADLGKFQGADLRELGWGANCENDVRRLERRDVEIASGKVADLAGFEANAARRRLTTTVLIVFLATALYNRDLWFDAPNPHDEPVAHQTPPPVGGASGGWASVGPPPVKPPDIPTKTPDIPAVTPFDAPAQLMPPDPRREQLELWKLSASNVPLTRDGVTIERVTVEFNFDDTFTVSVSSNLPMIKAPAPLVALYMTDDANRHWRLQLPDLSLQTPQSEFDFRAIRWIPGGDYGPPRRSEFFSARLSVSLKTRTLEANPKD